MHDYPLHHNNDILVSKYAFYVIGSSRCYVSPNYDMCNIKHYEYNYFSLNNPSFLILCSSCFNNLDIPITVI